ncbi:MAG: DALR domain-containing protein [Candidatus Eisenbacteria bacterium]
MKRATIYPRVTQHIPEIQALIAELVQKGVAYAAGATSISASRSSRGTASCPSARPTSPFRRADRAGRVEGESARLRALEGRARREPYWDSPWGRGRPGWHIECSAMSMKYLGPNFDLHGGGIDLIFPHHENEIAQSEAATGREFSNYWVHNGLVLLDGQKMSKSTKHFFLAEEISKLADPAAIRFYLLSTHYRSPIDFSQERLDEASVAFGRIRQTAEALNEVIGPPPGVVGEPIPSDSIGNEEIRQAALDFRASIEDDFNSAGALGHLFGLSRTLNRMLAEPSGGEKEARLREGHRVFHHLVGVLGLNVRPAEVEVPGEILALAEQRTAARQSKDWARADALRKELTEKGWIVEDREGKTVVRPNR